MDLPADLETALTDLVAANGFSGVVLVAEPDRPVIELAAGLADRAEGRPIRVDTRFATASITKGFTALAIVSLIEDGTIDWATTVGDLLGDEIPAIERSVTVEHLLGHTSGMGDYLDEEALGDIDDYVLDVPVHTLLGPEDFVPILERFPQVEPPGTRFRYNNGGYITLALLAERASGVPYHQLVTERVFDRAGLAATAFDRSDRLPANAALGYLADGRTNVLHLPVVGTGDGGAYTTAADLLTLWDALFAGRIVGADLVARMVAHRSTGDDGDGYGLGFWLGIDGAAVALEGMDAGVSGRTARHRPSGITYAVLANDSSGTWPVAKLIEAAIAGRPVD